MASSAINRIVLAERQAQEAERKAKEDIKASLLEVERSLQRLKEESYEKAEIFLKERQLLSNRKGSLKLSQVDEELTLTISNLEKIASSNTAEAMKFVVENVCSEYLHLVTETIYK